MKKLILSKLSSAKREAKALRYLRTAKVLGQIFGMKKVAEQMINRRNIGRIVEDHLIRRDGFSRDEIPDIDWGSYVVGTLENVFYSNGWDESMYEEVRSAVIQEKLLGENFETGGSVKSFADWIRKWKDEGQSTQSMEKMIGNMVAHAAIQKYKKFDKQRRSPGDGQPMKGIEQKTDDSGEGTGSGQTSDAIFENMFEVNPAGSGAGKFMQIMNETPDLKGWIDKANRHMKSLDNWKTQVMWAAFVQNPDIMSLRGGKRKIEYFDEEKGEMVEEKVKVDELEQQEVTYVDPDTGKKVTKKVKDVFGSSTYYYKDKVIDELKKAVPELAEWMEDAQRSVSVG